LSRRGGKERTTRFDDGRLELVQIFAKLADFGRSIFKSVFQPSTGRSALATVEDLKV